MKIAAQMYTVREHLKTQKEIAVSLRRIKEIGYNAVQASGLGPIDAKQFKSLADDQGLTICATHVPYIELQNDLKTVIETHQMWDCTYVGIGSMPEVYRGGKEGYQQFAAEASTIARELNREGLQLVYHNHNFEYAKYGDTLGMDMLLNEFDSAVQFELDVYWAQAGGADPVAWIRKLAGRMKVVHLKDMAVTPAREQLFAEVGEGNMNWPSIIDACNETGIEWGAVEQDSGFDNPFDSLALSLRNLRSMAVEI